MRMLLAAVAIFNAAMAAPPGDATSAIVPLGAQAASESRYKLLDVVVFGAFLRVDLSTYPAEVRTLLQQHLERSDRYRPRSRTLNAKQSEMRMVYAARDNYERQLFAVAVTPEADRLAQQYVDELRPCYEWEGFHDCPEREATFAAGYLAKNPGSPFRDFLPLLIAHRWLCAAAGYEIEQKVQDAARARRAAAAPLATALKAQSLLIRTAAQELRDRGRCRGDR